MFDNIGKKVEGLAYFICIIGIISSIITGIIFISIGSFVYGFLIALLGSIFSWISSWITYAIGYIADNINPEHAIEVKEPPIAKIMNSDSEIELIDENVLVEKKERKDSIPVKPIIEGEFIICPKCHTKQKSNRNICWECGQKFIEIE